MTAFKGLFALQTPSDLFRKLEHDYERILASPMDAYAAFDFFVTAEHVVDWLYPNDSDKKQRENLRQANLVLQACSHIANGSKHFEARAKQHGSVQNTIERPAMRLGQWKLGISRLGMEEGLEIQFQGQAAIEFGTFLDTPDFAKKVLEFWRQELTKLGLL